METKGLGKKKPVVDASAPKKPQSAFILFSASAREQLKKDEPDIKQSEILKKIGAQWKALSEEEKKEWEDKAVADKERYQQEKGAKGGDSAGDKRPANKGTGAGSKKAKKETQSEENEEESNADEGAESDEEDEEEDTKE